MAQDRRPAITTEEVSRAVRGDRAAVTAIVEMYLPRVYGLCLRIASRRDLAEEATQETFVRALRALGGLKKAESLGSWLLMIAANTTKEVVREASGPPLVDVDLPERKENEGDGLEVRKKAIEHAISTLDPGDRALFLLHTVEGVDLEELARDRETTPAAMKSRVHRIRVKVRERAARYLEEQGEES